ncbi:MAG: putative esterase [Microbacteriaceae bacterium]|nr:putative esterase [Microbacteriaceae bacterium]
MSETYEYDAANGLSLDLHRGDEGSPVVIYAHGGGFARGARDTDAARLAEFAAHGLTMASIDYRLAPEARYPDPVDDVLTAARFLHDNSAMLGLGSAAIGAIGASAGGYLVTMAALRDPSAFRAVSPWFSTADFTASAHRTGLEESFVPVSYEKNLLGEADPDSLWGASPVHQDMTGTPPFLIVHGELDRIVVPLQGRLLHEALLAAGRSSLLLSIAGAGHEDERFDAGAYPALIAGWFRSSLAQSERR